MRLAKSPSDSYHHEDLPTALLEAVDDLVREHGVGAVTLRAAARRAGVSHAAPAHHFGDKAGLLTAYATQGVGVFRDRLAAASAEATATGESPLIAIGMAYVRFAVEQPGRFRVMFRSELLHHEDPAYRQVCEAAFAVLFDTVRLLRPDLDPEDPELMRAAVGAWSIAHGLATLWLDGNLVDDIASEPPDEAAAAIIAAIASTLERAISYLPASARQD